MARARVEGDIRCAVSPSMCVFMYVCEEGERECRLRKGGRRGEKRKERKGREESNVGVELQGARISRDTRCTSCTGTDTPIHVCARAFRHSHAC